MEVCRGRGEAFRPTLTACVASHRPRSEGHHERRWEIEGHQTGVGLASAASCRTEVPRAQQRETRRRRWRRRRRKADLRNGVSQSAQGETTCATHPAKSRDSAPSPFGLAAVPSVLDSASAACHGKMAAGWRPTRALLAFLVVLAAGSTGALRSLAVRSGATPLSFTLPLKMRPGQFHNHEARALLVNGTLPLHGAVKDLG